MQSLLYALNIGTLATWLAVSGASTVAVAIKVHERLPKLLNPSEEVEMAVVDLDQQMGSAPPAAPADAVPEEISQPEEIPEEIPEVPVLPEIPEVAEMDPLPDIPDLPPVADGELKPKPQAQPSATRKSDQPKPAKRSATAATGTPGGQGTGQGAGTAQGAGNSQTGSNRWAGLYAPKPNYPSASKAAGHQGRVGITFEVDERGYIVNARVSSPCAYPELNDEALAKVRSSWRAKPGPRAQATKTIVFQIN